MQVYVVYADCDDARRMNEDALFCVKAEAQKHAKELHKMGCKPVVKTYDSEQAFHAKQVKVRGY